jgi:hypothetical protein
VAQNGPGNAFTVTLTDSHGLLSANTSAAGGGGTISGTGTTSLTIVGTLSQVNADLTTLTDNDKTPGPDIINVTATDSLGNSAQPQTIGVTTAGTPVIALTTPQTIGVGQPAIGIAVGNVTESGAASGETFSVELKDSTGLLSATGGTAASNDTTDLFINNVSLATLNSDLASLASRRSAPRLRGPSMPMRGASRTSTSGAGATRLRPSALAR